MKNVRAVAILSIFIASGGCSKAPDNSGAQATSTTPEGLVGRWCFKPSTVQATWDFIEIFKDKAYWARDHHGDGSVSKQSLVSKSDGLWIGGSETEDRYVIPPHAGGDLVVADSEGEIGRAIAMPAASTAADCFRQ